MRKSKIAILVLFLVDFTFLFSLTSCNRELTIYEILDETNSSSGEMLDEMTQFDGAYIIGDNFYYNYTILNSYPFCENLKERKEFLGAVTRRLMKQSLDETINVTPIFKSIGELGYNVIFKYKCEGGIDLTEVEYEYVGGDYYIRIQDQEWDSEIDLFLEGLEKGLKLYPTDLGGDKDRTSSSRDISFYKLKESKIIDDNGTIITFKVPEAWERIEKKYLDENELTRFEFFEDTGYSLNIQKLETRNTVRLNDKLYNDIGKQAFEEEYNNDPKNMAKLLPSSIFKDLQIVDVEFDLIIDGKYFFKRVSYFKDARLVDTFLENINVTEFHFVTLVNKRKYTLTISYYGNDKGVSELGGLFNTIAGTIKFSN